MGKAKLTQLVRNGGLNELKHLALIGRYREAAFAMVMAHKLGEHFIEEELRRYGAAEATLDMKALDSYTETELDRELERVRL